MTDERLARTFAIPRHDAPELCKQSARKKTEGAGNAGCPMHPQPRVQSVESTRVSLVTVIGGYGLSKPGRARKTSADLTPATGARTTRLCRTPQRRSSNALSIAHGKPPCDHDCAPTLPRPPHPVPTFATTMIRPSCGPG